MADSLLTPSVIAKEALMQLENNLVMGMKVHRQYKKEFVKVGDTVSIRRPVKFDVVDGATLQLQDVIEGKTSIVIDKRKHVAWDFSTQDLTLTIEQYSERYIKPAMIRLANQVDYDLLALYKAVWNWVGTAGQTVNSYADFSKAPERLDLGAVPTDPRCAVLTPTDHWALLGSQTALFIQDAARGAYRNGSLGMIGGVDTYMDQNVNTHTVGAHGGTPLVDGASQNVTYLTAKDTYTQTLITDGWTTDSVLKAGDVFVIHGVFAVNPVNKQTLPHLQQFVLTADVTTNSSAAADTNLTISPPIITSGPYQTVSAAPANDATITYSGTAATGYPQNLVFHENAFALVTVPLEMPDGVAFKARETHKGISVRVLKDYDVVNDVDIIRLDVLYGTKAIYPDLATRLSGTS
jgi:hypothetical protein